MIDKLQDTINAKKAVVTVWLEKERKSIKRKGLPLPIYSSFDLRDAGYKSSIVDSNLFPAGFNNMGGVAKDNAVAAFKRYIEDIVKEKNILLVAESHTRNKYYLSNLCSLRWLLREAGCSVTLGHLIESEGDIEVVDAHNHKLTLEKIQRKGKKVFTTSFSDGFVLVNNDFSVGAPIVLKGISQLVIPPLFLGWAHRKKSTHCRYVDKLLVEFAKTLKIDPWLVQAYCSVVDDVDFGSGKNIDMVAKAVDRLIVKIQKKYDEYGISEKPYVFVKDNSGTYGMGILSVGSGSEILTLNSDKRRKMVFGKDKSKIDSVMIQEGVRTIHSIDGGGAEPVLYSVGGEVIGGFMRVHSGKDSSVSLNAPGQKFDMLLETPITKPLLEHITSESELSLYKVLGDIANLAIAYEYGDCKG
ncbi:MAG: glutamate--cysteine ligase [Nanoarchaeota archaeon]|nr:glutamate--cysteine ligase [Nanoarchaeota archaeon]